MALNEVRPSKRPRLDQVVLLAAHAEQPSMKCGRRNGRDWLTAGATICRLLNPQ